MAGKIIIDFIYVKHPYKRVSLSATFGSRQYEHLEENFNWPYYLPSNDILHIKDSELDSYQI